MTARRNPAAPRVAAWLRIADLRGRRVYYVHGSTRLRVLLAYLVTQPIKDGHALFVQAKVNEHQAYQLCGVRNAHGDVVWDPTGWLVPRRRVAATADILAGIGPAIDRLLELDAAGLTPLEGEHEYALTEWP